MGAGASGQRSTPIHVYQAYDSVDDVHFQPSIGRRDGDDWKSDQDGSQTPSLDLSVSDSSHHSDESSIKGENSSVAGTLRGVKSRKRVRFAAATTVSGGQSDNAEMVELADSEDNWDDVSQIAEADILRLNLENGQTRLIKYDCRTTTTSHVIESLRDKLKFSTGQFFALALVKRSEDGQTAMTVIDPEDNVHDKVALKLREDREMRCFLRVAFVPGDVNEVLARDPVVFNYLYTQSCNDVVEERYASELSCDEVLDLGSLQLLQWAFDERIQKNKILRNIENGWDLSPFMPKSLLKTLTAKQVRRRVVQKVKVHLLSYQNSFQVKREYLKRVEELPSFAGRRFHSEKYNENILVGPKNGIQIFRNSLVADSVRFTQLISLSVDHRLHWVKPTWIEVKLEFNEQTSRNRHLELYLSANNADDFVALVNGYFTLHTNRKLPTRITDDPQDRRSDVNYSTGYYQGNRNESSSVVMRTDDQLLDRLNGINVNDNKEQQRVISCHLCQLSCGFCPHLETVVNQLEKVLPPPKDNSCGKGGALQPVSVADNCQLHYTGLDTGTLGHIGQIVVSDDEWRDGVYIDNKIHMDPEVDDRRFDLGHVDEQNVDCDICMAGFNSKTHDHTCHSQARCLSSLEEEEEEQQDLQLNWLRQFPENNNASGETKVPLRSTSSFLDYILEPVLEDSCFYGNSVESVDMTTALLLPPPSAFSDDQAYDAVDLFDDVNSISPLTFPKVDWSICDLEIAPPDEYSSAPKVVPSHPSPPPFPLNPDSTSDEDNSGWSDPLESTKLQIQSVPDWWSFGVGIKRTTDEGLTALPGLDRL